MEIFYYNGEIYLGGKTETGLLTDTSIKVTGEAFLAVINFLKENNIEKVKLSATDDKNYTFKCSFSEDNIDSQEEVCYNDQAEEKATVTNLF